MAMSPSNRSEFHGITSCEITGRPCEKVIRINTSVVVQNLITKKQLTNKLSN